MSHGSRVAQTAQALALESDEQERKTAMIRAADKAAAHIGRNDRMIAHLITGAGLLYYGVAGLMAYSSSFYKDDKEYWPAPGYDYANYHNPDALQFDWLYDYHALTLHTQIEIVLSVAMGSFGVAMGCMLGFELACKRASTSLGSAYRDLWGHAGSAVNGAASMLGSTLGAVYSTKFPFRGRRSSVLDRLGAAPRQTGPADSRDVTV